MTEDLVVINNRAQGLYGIVHLPQDFQHAPRRSGLLLIHGQGGNKIGHKRSFVELGRYLETKGVATFRIDLLGEGESEELSEDPYLNWRGLKPAINYFWDSLSLHRLLILGDCFGGLLATYYAALEPRIEHVMVWNLAQMKWTDEQLADYDDAPSGVEPFRYYWQRLSEKDTWEKLIKFRVRPGQVGKRLLVNPIKDYAWRRFTAARKSMRTILGQAQSSPQENGDSGKRRVPVSIFHAPSTRGGTSTIYVAEHVFRKLGTDAEHILIAGVPFSQSWKATAFSEVEKRILGSAVNKW